MELQDPITNTTINEQQLAAAAASIQPTTTISPSDEENSSIITVRSNGSGSMAAGAGVDAPSIGNVLQLHLVADSDDDDGVHRPISNAEKSSVGSFVSTMRSEHLQQVSPTDAPQPLQTIVEVVNPLITGEGYANRIAVGHTSDPTYPSFDASDNGNVADDEYDSFNAYNPGNELSLNDKMKNVLQELVTNERVRLSFSQSITEDDDDEDSDDENHDDTDDDEHEPLQLDEFDGVASATATATTVAATAQSLLESNGNIESQAEEVIARVISSLPADTIDTSDIINIETITIATTDEASDDERVATNKDIKNANVVVQQQQQQQQLLQQQHHPSQHIVDVTVLDVDDNIVYENPNFLAASCEIDETSRRLQTNERNEKLKEKLLSELNIDEKRNVIPAAVELVDEVVDVAARVINKECMDDDKNNDDDDDEGPSEATTSTEASSRSTNASKTSTSTGASSKRKKRKSKAKKK